VLANLFPSGDRLMEDFYYAGGLPALMQVIAPFLSLHERTVAGCTMADQVNAAQVLDAQVIRPLDQPVSTAGAGSGAGQSGPRWRGDQAQCCQRQTVATHRSRSGV
jgi:dihydroxyacid dehydratase/phosphogluconate dehydratase